jgi:hypothetical protein
VFEPRLEEAQIDPQRATLRWEEPVHQVAFRFRVPATAEGRRLAGKLWVFLGAFVIGEADFWITVSATAPIDVTSRDPVPVSLYRRIFASYSHKDTEVVRAVEDHVTTTGDRYLIDAQVLRSGERWEPRLAELIEQADLFQLFWSYNAMRSPFVRQEWEHALGLGRQGFVRPVYWQEPLPEQPDQGLPPDALRQLHFAKLPSQHVPATPPIPPEDVVSPRPEAGGEHPPSEAPPTMQAQAPTQPAPAVISSPKTSRPSQPGDLICGACGESISPERKFCRRCGSPLASADVVKKTSSISPLSWLVRVLAVLVLLGGVIYALYALLR